MATSLASTLVLTEAAQALLDLHFQDREKPCLRVFLSFMYESGPRLDLAPDAPGPDDTVCQAGGWTFAVKTLLLEQAAPITVDIGPEGFCMRSSLDFTEAGGNCGGSCGDHH